ncbi:MAG: hypothetical protein GWP91_06175 [Rhodobacterales bacterium]|nr:hypothetical protein [Rhodobacterales bacterium]
MRACLRLLLLSTASFLFIQVAQAADFTGPYDASNWQIDPIPDGTTTLNPGSTFATAIWDYDLNFGGGGVSFRTAEVSVIADADGLAAFDWDYTFQHAWYLAEAELVFFAIDASDVRQEYQAYDAVISGGDTDNGTISSLPIAVGKAFGFTVGGANFDSNSFLNGTVTLSNFEVTDCLGVLGGSATVDACGTCDADPTNDCVNDCNGVPGGLAMRDACGTCDANPGNDCLVDCAGTPGGLAILDACGTCDADPTNDCLIDCNGIFGGFAMLDNCGVCDADPTNDCPRDCNGDWGGLALVDDCGVCDEDPTNDCSQDCNGDWGGAAVLDECGVCDNDVTNDCDVDCNGDPGGNATLDDCGVCDSDPNNDCVEDCNGDLGGAASLDGCDVCDADPSNDCVADCSGVFGGTAEIDACGVCSAGRTYAVACAPDSSDGFIQPAGQGCSCTTGTSLTGFWTSLMVMGLTALRRRRTTG